MSYQEFLAPKVGNQLSFLPPPPRPTKRRYGGALTVSMNGKGVLDIDTVKGCALGMAAYPDGGCYGECYAKKIADRCGIDFSTAVSRKLVDPQQHRDVLIRKMLDHPGAHYRIGVMGDPCHDWNGTCATIHALRYADKVPVIVTKHWRTLSDDNISRLVDLGAVVNTSTSGMDTEAEIDHRVGQLERLRRCGVRSVCRVVTCQYGGTAWAVECAEKQEYLLSLEPVIDNPFRCRTTNQRVIDGDIITTHRDDSVGGGKTVSLYSKTAYLGRCSDCPDQCGVNTEVIDNIKGGSTMTAFEQVIMFEQQDVQEGIADNVEFQHVESVIGSGYEEQVAALALEDGIAHRAARKNMQIHSAIIVLIDGEFVGFFTFQNNHEVGEFCLLQSAIEPAHHTPELYLRMAEEVVKQNTANYPALITTNPKSAFETPAVFESLGFQTYLKMSGFHYMVKGDPAVVRLKLLAHITMTNVWNSTKADWLRIKKEWNEHIELDGARAGIDNPKLATREGCWQGESGFSNVVTGRSHNKNASVLDPTACEVILRMFTPTDGNRVYNPFGGGVQMGYVAGAYGYEYVASEIRQNQCDANNAICGEFPTVKWVCADSSKYEPEGTFDLVFACPPYYRIEKYLDYDGNPPEGEINHLDSYEAFRDALFAGYARALAHLADNRFFVIMTGDIRDNKGAYRCHEAETELWMQGAGLAVYNRIVYLEGAFTRLAQAKKTLNTRKFPKQEQKIIVGFKGKADTIKDLFPPIGRL